MGLDVWTDKMSGKLLKRGNTHVRTIFGRGDLTETSLGVHFLLPKSFLLQHWIETLP